LLHRYRLAKHNGGRVRKISLMSSPAAPQVKRSRRHARRKYAIGKVSYLQEAKDAALFEPGPK
jgi:hypothetical protein